MTSSPKPTPKTCPECGKPVAIEPDGGFFCMNCARQSFWQRTWSVLWPAGEADDALWWRRAASAAYFFLASWVTLILAIFLAAGRSFSGRFADPGHWAGMIIMSLLVFGIFFVPVALGVGYLLRWLLPESGRSRLIVGVVAFAASVIVPVVMVIIGLTRG